MENDQSQLEAKEKALKLAESGDNVAVARAILNKDQTAAAIIREQLSELTITSPVDGVVASKNIEVGEMVSPQTTLFNIAQIDPLLVTVNVSDQIIADIHPGTEAQITVPALGAKIFPGKVTKVSPVSDQVSHAYPVKIQIANPDRSMLPGMTASVVFTGLKTQPGIVIPVQAVVETPQGSEVFTVENGVAHMHMVQLGAVSSDRAVVLSGLNPGEQLVINGQSLLSDGSRVTVVQSADQAGVGGQPSHVAGGRVRTDAQPGSRAVFGRITLDQGTRLAATDQLVGQIEQLIRNMPETDMVYTVVGSPGENFISSQAATNTASINVTLKPLSQRKRSVFQETVAKVLTTHNNLTE